MFSINPQVCTSTTCRGVDKCITGRFVVGMGLYVSASIGRVIRLHSPSGFLPYKQESVQSAGLHVLSLATEKYAGPANTRQRTKFTVGPAS